jgi:hypothetical protein
MIHRIVYIIMGILVIFAGFDVLDRGSFYYFGLDVKVGNEIYLSVLIILLGLFFIWMALRKQFTNTHIKVFKCIRCGRLVQTNTLEKLSCPFCGDKLEDLEGFFERHPEHKNMMKKDII